MNIRKSEKKNSFQVKMKWIIGIKHIANWFELWVFFNGQWARIKKKSILWGAKLHVSVKDASQTNAVTQKKNPSFNLTNVDHLYVNRLFVMLLLPIFFFQCRVVYFLCWKSGIVVIRIGCHLYSIRRNTKRVSERTTEIQREELSASKLSSR